MKTGLLVLPRTSLHNHQGGPPAALMRAGQDNTTVNIHTMTTSAPAEGGSQVLVGQQQLSSSMATLEQLCPPRVAVPAAGPELQPRPQHGAVRYTSKLFNAKI